MAQTPSGAKEILTNRQRLKSSMASLMTRSFPMPHRLSDYELNFEWNEQRVRVFLTNIMIRLSRIAWIDRWRIIISLLRL